MDWSKNAKFIILNYAISVVVILLFCWKFVLVFVSWQNNRLNVLLHLQLPAIPLMKHFSLHQFRWHRQWLVSRHSLSNRLGTRITLKRHLNPLHIPHPPHSPPLKSIHPLRPFQLPSPRQISRNRTQAFRCPRSHRHLVHPTQWCHQKWAPPPLSTDLPQLHTQVGESSPQEWSHQEQSNPYHHFNIHFLSILFLNRMTFRMHQGWHLQRHSPHSRADSNDQSTHWVSEKILAPNKIVFICISWPFKI